MAQKVIKFMDTSFRDGFQSVFGARVSTADFLPALQASVDAGITHFEAGGGARFQSLFFYCGESAFDMMDQFRNQVGPNANLQTLARGINVVALSQQPRDIIELHAKMFKKHGMTTIRNFDALNDVRNLKYSGEMIHKHGLKHQIVIAVMDLPPGCEGAHTSAFYLDRLRQILESDIPFDSICFKDASGTCNPRKLYETIKGARKMVPSDTVLWVHSHDTAGVGVTQYMAAIEAGVDGIDLSKSPVSGGTAQPDILSMWHALKGTEWTLDVDHLKILKAEEVFEECMKDYFFPPEAKMVTPIVPLSPMPGGALTANTMMMRDTGTLHLYKDVIKEMGDVVRLGGFGTSVTPVSQFYFQQAFLNVTQGPWKKINPAYGEMVLGYFGRTPVPADPMVVKIASEQLGKPVFTGDPLDELDPGIPKAEAILSQHGLPLTDENLFIIASCEAKGLDFLLGKAEMSIRKKSDEPKVSLNPQKSQTEVVRAYQVVVDGQSYNVQVGPSGAPLVAHAHAPADPIAHGEGLDVHAPTPGKIMALKVAVGDQVNAEDVVLVMEAMKMETDIKAPIAGRITGIYISEKDNVQTGDVLLTIG